jgi:SOS-response transcriptional repressor LexA
VIRLQPRNSELQPILVDADKLEIQGKVVAVLRQI